MPQLPHEQEFELYHYPESLCSQMVRIALSEKGYEWKFHSILLEEVALNGTNLTDEYLEINPKGQVPTLVHNGVPVYESYDIIRYLDTLHPDRGTRLIPEDPELDEQVTAWVLQSSLRDDVSFGQSLGTSIPMLSAPIIKACIDRQPVFHVLWKSRKHPVPLRRWGFCLLRILPILPKLVFRDSLATVAGSLVSIEKALEQTQGPFLLGAFTQADVMMMAHFHRLEDVGLAEVLDWTALPETRGYWERLQARPSYKSAITDWHEESWRWGIQKLLGGEPSKRVPALKRKITKLLLDEKA